ncbi:MAG: hypothetical protein HC767_07960 [Akkermansiaceae bacterium]|nr:hypothetical protein [Akkermansiaceae bacterium]
MLLLATSTHGVNRPVDTEEFLRSCEALKELLEGVVVDSSCPLRDSSAWSFQRQRVEAEIALQAASRKPAMTDAVLVSMDSFFRYSSSCQAWRYAMPSQGLAQGHSAALHPGFFFR